MIDETTIQAIATLERDKYRREEIDGVPMGSSALHDLRPKLPMPALLELHTLEGLVDYVSRDVDDIQDLTTPKPELAVHVVSPTEVRLVGKLAGVHLQRPVYVIATHAEKPFAFGSWYGTEEFVIRLATMFVESPELAEVIKLAGTVTAEQAVKTEDDGITQTVTVKQGVTFVGRTAVPNPVTLAPFRTFHELEQPAGKFLLRARGGGDGAVEWALFEADGGAWRNVAIRRAAAYVGGALGGEWANAVAVIR